MIPAMRTTYWFFVEADSIRAGATDRSYNGGNYTIQPLPWYSM
jgi:hypothetical protein